MNYYNSAEGPAESVKPLQSAYDRLRSDFQLTGPEKYGNDLPGSVGAPATYKPDSEYIYGNDQPKSASGPLPDWMQNNATVSAGANPIYDAINSIQPGTPNALADLKAKVEQLKQMGIPGNTPIDPSLAEPLYNLFSQKAEGVR